MTFFSSKYLDVSEIICFMILYHRFLGNTSFHNFGNSGFRGTRALVSFSLCYFLLVVVVVFINWCFTMYMQNNC
jgi:hypothetical protein